MIVCTCQRDGFSGSDLNLTIVDTEKLQKMIDSDHEDKVNAEAWLNAINVLYNEFKTGDKLWFTVEYNNPNDYSPEEASVEQYPITVDFACEVWTH
jgi:hypothetical protein